MSAYRISGAIVAVVAALLLVWTVIASFGPEQVVTPTSAVKATNADGAEDAQGVLAARTELQRWREVSGPSPGADAPNPAVGPQERLLFDPRANLRDADQLVAEWWQNPPQGEEILRGPEFVQGITSVPYPVANVFEQPQGRDWRRLHNDQVRYGGGWLVFGVVLALALFLFARGRVRLAEGYSGERIERFNAVERSNHWMAASSFIVLGLTGLVIIYGKPLILPLIGADAIGWVARSSAWLHMAFAVPFVIGVLIMIGLWLVQNLPDRYDWPWLKSFGGFLSDSAEKPPAGRFNAGQKIVFWGVVLGGLALLASGLALMFPFYWFGYDGMQWAQLAHAAIALLMVALILGHIYIGTVGMEDAFEAMWSGKVDRNWLKEHHSAWYEKIAGKRGERKSEARQQPAE